MAREKLRGSVALVALGLALAAPAHAAAPQTHKYKGELDGGGAVSLRLNAKGDPVVDKIFMTSIAVRCDEGSGSVPYFAVQGSTPLSAKRDFSVRSEDGSGGKARVKGKFSRKYDRVKGFVRVHGTFTDRTSGTTVTNCDSGKVPYTAR